MHSRLSSTHRALVFQHGIVATGEPWAAQVKAAWGEDVHPVIAGLTNTYSSYITTFEEYGVQRYEGASTLYGPHTLDAYIQVNTAGRNHSKLLWRQNRTATSAQAAHLGAHVQDDYMPVSQARLCRV